jgi:hypothetical protein
MRFLTIWRLAAILLLVLGSAVLSAPDEHALAAAAVVAVDDKDNGKQKDDDGNNGNDEDDGDDDGNRGKNKDKDKNDKNGKAKGKDKGKKADDVVATAEYRVDVVCGPLEDGTQTECTFTGIAPPDAKKVGHVDMPAEIACAEVIGGDFKYVDPDPHTRVTGYTSRGNQGMFTLVLEGSVTTGGTTTYWIKAGPGVFPAAGPGLICDAPAGTSAQATVEPTTGDVLVVAYTCTDVPADTSTFDWFGACQPGGEVRQFMLAPTDAPDDQQPLETNGEGEAATGELAPGTYSLEHMDDPWCHANSDNVTPEGHVTVEAGQRTTVWTFHCSGDEPLK